MAEGSSQTDPFGHPFGPRLMPSADAFGRMPSADAFGRMPSADAFGHTFGLNPVILRNDLTGVLNVKHSRDDLLRHCADFIEFIQGRIFVISCLQRRP